VRSRRTEIDAAAPAPARAKHAVADRDRSPHHPRFCRTRQRRSDPLMPGESAQARAVKGESANARLVKRAGAPRVLCAGIIVLDEGFRVEEFPRNDGKVEAQEFFGVNGGCAANAAVAVARLGGRAVLAGPLGGPAGIDENGDRVLAALAREAIDTSACQRVDGLATTLSAIFMNERGERTIVTYRDRRIGAVTPRDPEALARSADIVLADNCV